MPITDMVTEIHDLLMERIHKKRDAMAKVDSVLLPKVRKLVDYTVKASVECRVIWDGKREYQVKWMGVGFCVNLQEQTCSCRVWDLTGIPCLHGVAAILPCKLNPMNFISNYYKKETYMRCYSHFLEVLNGRPFWEEAMRDTILPPPISKVLRGRPKKQRRKEGWESRTNSSKRQPKDKVQSYTRVGRIMHCGNCNAPGHNIRKCPQPISENTKTRRRKTKAKAGGFMRLLRRCNRKLMRLLMIFRQGKLTLWPVLCRRFFILKHHLPWMKTNYANYGGGCDKYFHAD